MHKYLRSIGFSQHTSKKDIDGLLEEIVSSAESVDVIHLEHGNFTCISKSFGHGIGLTVCGEYDEHDVFQREYYFPYVLGDKLTTSAACSIQRHAEKCSFSGLCEENKLGISLIFYLQNPADYMRRGIPGDALLSNADIVMSALSTSGKILLPVKKTENEAARCKVAQNRYDLIEAAKNGDESAMESLTLEDIDLYAQISRRIRREDVYSIVDSTFMPNGVECDHYTIIGEILDMELCDNSMTGEQIYSLLIACNDLPFQVAINKMDLLGEPAVGRRFKGEIWMQGLVDFETGDY